MPKQPPKGVPASMPLSDIKPPEGIPTTISLDEIRPPQGIPMSIDLGPSIEPAMTEEQMADLGLSVSPVGADLPSGTIGESATEGYDIDVSQVAASALTAGPLGALVEDALAKYAAMDNPYLVPDEADEVAGEMQARDIYLRDKILRGQESPEETLAGSVIGSVGQGLMIPGTGMVGVGTQTSALAGEQMLRQGKLDPEALALTAGLGSGIVGAGKVATKLKEGTRIPFTDRKFGTDPIADVARKQSKLSFLSAMKVKGPDLADIKSVRKTQPTPLETAAERVIDEKKFSLLVMLS